MSSSEKKKISLAQAMKDKLAQQKQQQPNGKQNRLVKSTQPLKNQLTKKPNNQKKRTGI
ncbi:hypothetical protein [Bacillus salacetis]|uniref:hypothetical protein n=1 Tax=Bacillus salacetis TaxID=2315464 RepID=UPI0014438E08|nr:hypothetical protein [Bacillus salacetis]